MTATSQDLVDVSTKLALSKKAEDIVIMDVRDLTSVTDFFILCSGNSDTQIKAIADAITDGLEQEDVLVWHKEGYHGLKWILLDYVDFVVHVFQKEAREFYGLEKLWGDARMTRVEDN